MTIFDILFAINTPEAKVQRDQYRAMVKFLRQRIAQVGDRDPEQRVDLFYYLIMLHLKYEQSGGNEAMFCEWYKELHFALLAHEHVLKITLKKSTGDAYHRAYLQLMYFYKLTLHYFDQLITQLTNKHFVELTKNVIAERLLFYSHKKFLQGKYIDFFDVKRKEFSYRFRKHYALFALVGSIGFITFWHGLTGVIDLIPILNIPIVSLALGLLVLVLSGFFYTFAGQQDQADHSDS